MLPFIRLPAGTIHDNEFGEQNTIYCLWVLYIFTSQEKTHPRVDRSEEYFWYTQNLFTRATELLKEWMRSCDLHSYPLVQLSSTGSSLKSGCQ